MDISEDDLAACIRVLKAIEADRSHLTRLTRDQRRELLTLAGLVAKPERHDLVKMAKAFRRAEREAAKEQDRKAIDQAGLRVQRRSPVYAPLRLEPPKPEDLADQPRLNKERDCYVCKQPFSKVHRYYDSMCEACGDFNYAKREQTADLSGEYALVTGARVKIGYQASLKLLRAGAHVVVTTRFPVDAATRYSQEPDFAAWRPRLQIHGLDLRHSPSVELFTKFLLERLPRLDYILNNACQTVRRPAGFFQHLLAREAAPIASLDTELRAVLADHDELLHRLESTRDQAAAALVVGAEHNPGEGLVHSAALSQRRFLDDDYRGGEALFPANRFDEDRQQVDLREMNSWRLRLHEVATPELVEVQLVNAIAPYILNARLRPLMMRTPGAHKHIVNVSAMEGQFYRATKTDKHPHTNMAKAALNMMTRTSAPDFVKDGIHMNAVDTGWITDEDPAIHAARKAELGFSPPLDIIDGAARIVDPVFAGRLTGAHVWGQFLKDYKPAPW
ncbi:MAG: L-fuco-beta-pyranose dehydrogenase [Steroidobacteraceae bacterium]|jgi:NAD(P)-dependent dehydrogenase (short-subunit alcohol dehydrogenase family)|nr:L-fuco-beta-pyranose dehydrogenase [Steroidobacteraceae bacterium]